jgi:hypothetical protein
MMDLSIRTRQTWSDGDQASFEIDAFNGETRMFTPGATVTRDLPFGATALQVSIRWSSSSSSGDLASAQAQLLVMEAALKLADLDGAK